ncbi:hypothetical protein B9Z65_7700 [Elsinoe australis]|uniref:tRNA (guanine(9)-N1)-methyltransferase n=1 Tax=Elsinoe australis TaxID=40998 RepID=A0A2P8A0A2_9PEZI|nr:hypothetical protein B9Z65_7700 [Elsinoe australis]
MSSDERPTKLRKLDNGTKDSTQDHDPPTSSDPPSKSVAKSTGPTAEEDQLAPATQDTPSNGTATQAPSARTPAPILDPARPNLKDPLLLSLAASHPGLSKNQLKKLRRQKQWDDAADARRAKRKTELQRKRERKRSARDALIASGVSPSELMKGSHRPRAIQLPLTLLIDCGFDGLMHDGERTSLGSQITRGYSENKNARWRVHLAVSSWGGKLRERFEGTLRGHYRGWKGVRFEEGGFTQVAGLAGEWMRGEEGGRLRGPFGKYLDEGKGEEVQVGDAAEEGQVKDGPSVETPAQESGEATVEDSNETVQQSSSAKAAKEAARAEEAAVMKRLQGEGEVVYLTAESPDTLTELTPYSTYIIGGIVDKNREKGICYKRACEAGIKTAKLPIGEYLEMQSRKVLATNHVVEIMLKWLEYEDWGKAFLEVIPKRKGGQLRAKGKGKARDDDSGSEVEADEVEDVDPDLEEEEGEEEPKESGDDNDDEEATNESRDNDVKMQETS